MIERKEFLQQLISFKEKDLIKVVTGIRRCGKSTLFELFKDYLLSTGVKKEQIISINFEDIDFEHLTNYKILHDYIKSQLLPDVMNYIFLDEVQHVDDWQKCVDSLYIKPNCDVYITGSNAYLLSGELSTLISGRYVQIDMFPLSFKEYMGAFPNNENIERKFEDYLYNGSFPYILELSKRKDIRAYLEGIYNSIILKDVVERKKIADVSILKSVINFMFDNIGNLCSTKSIADTLTSNGRKISVHTLENYLEALCDCFMLYKAERFDVKGKQYLKTLDKYYVADIGLRYYLLGKNGVDRGRILENVVYLELLRCGYEVHIGKVAGLEVDFVAKNDDGTTYFQVAETARAKETLERELKPLQSIHDHNPKFLLTMDIEPDGDYNGIKKLNALDWLLGN